MNKKKEMSASEARASQNILVVNTGSTSVKYKLFNKNGEEKFSEVFDKKNIKDKKKEKAFLIMIRKISKADGIKIAFRVVHGGDISDVQIINDGLKKKIKEFSIFAPIHNKLVLKKINLLKKNFEKTWDNKNFYAIFDTDFHKTIPEEFSTYPMDQEIAKKFKLKRYGFHGIAVESALEKVTKGFEKRGEKISEKIIFAHLGGGSSITAVKNGKSIANSMGLTPISGLMMTTRIGDVDSDLDKIVSQKIGKSINIISDMFSRKSGFLAITGSDNIKDIFDKVQSKKDGFEKENLAFSMYINQVVQKIGAYSALMGGVELVVFSGGIGEGNSFFRKKVLEKINHLGIDKNSLLAIKVNEEKLIFDKVKNL